MEPGTRLGPYEVVGALGAGGMGEVYRARDTRLGRDVAVKVLPAVFAADPERLRRFEQEARATAALSHPNILSVFDVGTADVPDPAGSPRSSRADGEESGRGAPPRDPPARLRLARDDAQEEQIERRTAPFIVTELLEGESLREHLRHGALPVRKAVEIAVAIANGLDAAHAKGIVHRDLKPENVFITDTGHVKILDFGIAKLLEPQAEPGATDVPTEAPGTRVGTVLGTAGYMSPEQVRGQAVDHRADIFALGCVLYELASGRPPFRGGTTADTLAAILGTDPQPLSGAGRAVPAALETVVRRCLEKRAADRFSSAHDLALALEAVTTEERASGPATSPRSGAIHPRRGRRVALGVAAACVAAAVVVLLVDRLHTRRGSAAALEPDRVAVAVLENRTGDPALDHLGQAAADAVTEALTKIGTGKVVPLATDPGAAGPRAAAAPGPEAVRALAAAAKSGLIVTGAYYLQGEDLQIQARLTDVSTDRLLYAIEPAVGTRGAPLAALDLVRLRVRDAVAARLLAPEMNILGTESRPPVMEALREYLAARDEWYVDFPAVIARLTRAIELDPGFVRARLRLADAYHATSAFRDEAAQIDLVERNPDSLTSFDRLMVNYEKDLLAGRHDAALNGIREAATQTPNDPDLIMGVASQALAANRPSECLAALARPIAWGRMVNPAKPAGSFYFKLTALGLHSLGQYERELDAVHRGLAVYPGDTDLRQDETAALAALGRLEDLAQLVARSQSESSRFGQPGNVMSFAAVELRAHGQRQASIAMAERAIEWIRAVPAAEAEGWRMELAAALVSAERWDEAWTVYQQLAMERPKGLYVKGLLGALAVRRGDRAEAMRIAEELRAVDRPYLFGINTWARARIAAQLGEKEQAVALLRQAIAQGFSGSITFPFALHRSPFFEPLHGYAPYEDLIRPKAGAD